jgi:2-iminoacetate synthase ThiH
VFPRVSLSAPLSDDAALALAGGNLADDGLAVDLRAAASSVRDALYGRVVTYSPKVFLPLTNLCRNHCDYCSFRRSPGDPGEWTMTPDEIVQQLAAAREPRWARQAPSNTCIGLLRRRWPVGYCRTRTRGSCRTQK